MLSNYACNLPKDIRDRYITKIKPLGFDPMLDDSPPSTLPWNYFDGKNEKKLPPITNIDILKYFVQTKSVYTFHDFKAYKSLEGYNYFVSGHVSKIKWIEKNGFIVIVGNVSNNFSSLFKSLLFNVSFVQLKIIITHH